jgi:hypothetical protein
MDLSLLPRRRSRALAGAATAALVLTAVAGASGSEPVAANDFATTTEGVPVAFNLLANDVDPDGGTLITGKFGEFEGANPLLLALSLDNHGNVLMEPRPGHTGVFSFEYAAIDEAGNLDKARAFVSVRAVDVPTISGLGEFQTGNGAVDFELSGAPGGQGLSGSLRLQRFRGTRISFFGNVINSLAGSGPNATMTGTGSWKGSPGHSFTVRLVEKGFPGAVYGDLIGVEIRDPAGAIVFTSADARLSSGNVTVR